MITSIAHRLALLEMPPAAKLVRDESAPLPFAVWLHDDIIGAGLTSGEAIAEAHTTIAGWATETARLAFVAAATACGSDPIAEENAALSIGRELLPPFALAVLESGEPTFEYWEWLTRQTEAAQAEHDREYALGHEWSCVRPVTNADIRALADEAGAHGDQAQCALCDQALAGDLNARAECERVINYARAEAGEQ